MFLYRVKYTESEYDIQNNDLLYKIHNTAKILSKFWTILEKRRKLIFLFFYFVIGIRYIIHILYVLDFCKLCNVFFCISLHVLLNSGLVLKGLMFWMQLTTHTHFPIACSYCNLMYIFVRLLSLLIFYVGNTVLSTCTTSMCISRASSVDARVRLFDRQICHQYISVILHHC